VTQIKTYSWDNAQVILVGNKCDMEDERVISYERGKQLAEQLGIEFFETSAKENVNVKVLIIFTLNFLWCSAQRWYKVLKYGIN
jgi:Ras-related protein Rab-3C